MPDDNIMYRAELRGQFYSTPRPSTPVARVARVGRKQYLIDFLTQLEQIDPHTATPHDVAEVLNVLVSAGCLSQAIIAQKMQTSKTTISRWLAMESPPRAIVRETIIKRSGEILKDLIKVARTG